MMMVWILMVVMMIMVWILMVVMIKWTDTDGGNDHDGVDTDGGNADDY